MNAYDINGNTLIDSIGEQTVEVLVASSDASDSIKDGADYLCTGTNDELIIQQAINYVANAGGGKIYLSAGKFYIDSFPSTDTGGDHVALMIPQKAERYNIHIIGADIAFGITKATEGCATKLKVTPTCYESLSASEKYTILRAGYVESLMAPSTVSMYVEQLYFDIPTNQKKITCLDLLYNNRSFVNQVAFYAYQRDYISQTPPPVAVEGCIGMRSMGGSNAGILADYRNLLSAGFYEGFALGSEHIVGINLASIWCVYGFTFGNYSWQANMTHPITLINCADERGVNLPLFVDNGYKRTYATASTGGKQAITLIDFNIERVAGETPGGVLGDLARETTPGKFRGSIEFTMTNNQFNVNSTDASFWEDGSGHGMVTRNQAHEQSGTSATRRAYKPTYMQRYYDTDVGKMLWCIDTANKTWVDSQGNTVA